MNARCLEFLVLGVLVAVAVPAAKAGSAVAWNPQTRDVAWRYGDQSAEIAEAWALDRCRNASNGRGECQIVVSCEQGGYGHVMAALDGRGRYSGVVVNCGATSAGVINKKTRNRCAGEHPHAQRCDTLTRWYDAVNDEGVPEQCKNQHPSADPCFEWPYPADYY